MTEFLGKPDFLMHYLTGMTYCRNIIAVKFEPVSVVSSKAVGGENMPERKFASTADRTHNHQVMSLTCSPLNHPGGVTCKEYQ